MSNTKYDTPELAERYDRISDSQFEKGSLLLEKMGLRKGDMVLDVGCGTGRLALHASGIVGTSGKVFGLDPSPPRVRIAEDKLKDLALDNVRFMKGQGEDLCLFSDNIFDYVYYSSVFHWIEDKRTALKEAYRVLKPGGKVGMTTGDRDNSFTLRAITNELIAREPYRDRVKADDDASKPVTKGELRELLAESGFVDVEIDQKETKRYYATPKEAFEFSEASSFGNALMHIPESLRAQAMEDIAVQLEKRRTPSGIELLSGSLFAIAVKPI